MATGTVEVIVTVGGEDDKVVLRSVESYDPVTHQWKNLAFLPFAVSKHGLVVSGENTCKSMTTEEDAGVILFVSSCGHSSQTYYQRKYISMAIHRSP